MAMTKTARPKKRGTGAASKKAPKRRPSLAAMNKWMAENHAEILKLAEKNTVRLTGKPRL
jgi:hypothetical protein